MPEISQQFIDPQTGRILPLSAYAPDLAAWQRTQSVELSPETRPTWFRPDGTMKTTAEIRDDEARAQFAKDRIAAEVRSRSHRELSEDERRVKSFTELIVQRTQEAKYLTGPQRIDQQQYIDTLKAKRAEVENKIAEEKRVESLNADRRVQLAREHSSTYLRSPPPGADPQAVAIVVALANRTDVPADVLGREYWTAVEVLEANALQVATKDAQNKREAALHAEMVAADSDVTVVATQLKVHQAQEAANGSN